jgi:predicted DNA-binding transcriptional regulator AlpA
MKINNNETLLTIKQISKDIGLSQAVLYNVLKYEKLPSDLIGGRIVIREGAYQEWKKRNINFNDEGGDK